MGGPGTEIHQITAGLGRFQELNF